jgi:acyl carrier protein
MSTEDWKELAQFIQENLATDSAQAISAKTPLLSSGLIESFSLVQLVVHLETTYKVKIPSALRTEDNFDTVGAMLELVNKIKKP